MLDFEKIKKLDIKGIYSDSEINEYVEAYNSFYYPSKVLKDGKKFLSRAETEVTDILYMDKAYFLREYNIIKLAIMLLRIGSSISPLFDYPTRIKDIDLYVPEKYMPEVREIFDKYLSTCTSEEKKLIESFSENEYKTSNSYQVFTNSIDFIFKNLTPETLILILQFNLERYQHQFLLREQGKLSVYGKNNNVYIDDEKYTLMKKNTHTLSIIKTTIGEEVAKIMCLNEDLTLKFPWFSSNGKSRRFLF